MCHQQKTNSSTSVTVQNEHKKSIQKQRIHAHEIESERDDIWDQLQQLLAEKSRWDETLKELQAHRDHWKMRAAEEEQYEEKLKTRMQELQNELDAAAKKNKAVQEDLNKRIQELEQQCMHLNSQLTKPTSSRAQQEPTTERKQLSSNPVLDSNQPARNEKAEELRRKIRQLKRELDRLEEAKRVPVRMLREHSEKMDPTLLCAFCSRRGLHYTDSCPTYVEPTRRREIVARSGRCRKCLDFCDERGYLPTSRIGTLPLSARFRKTVKSSEYASKVSGTKSSYSKSNFARAGPIELRWAGVSANADHFTFVSNALGRVNTIRSAKTNYQEINSNVRIEQQAYQRQWQERRAPWQVLGKLSAEATAAARAKTARWTRDQHLRSVGQFSDDPRSMMGGSMASQRGRRQWQYARGRGGGLRLDVARL
ncbi:unnamed protein product [Nippostrongylus brasiliensis]|uniref:CCHC-type domain-containing protein n=1 Tax=Nippostrongylus brasiliensis TaxID=27835 RepID=A0A0N4YQ59_NIPBR|nr:unnamed protein product [Nippostrongylus brasiliensis]